MQRSLLTPPVVVLALGAALALSPAAWAQTKVTAGIRGKVVDEKGAPIPAVKVDFEFTGESRQKITKSQLTDKKGGFVRVGLPGGPWKMAFTKEGYQSYFMDTYLSDGGFSEIPDVVVLSLMMARAEGFRALEIMRKDQRLRGTPVIVLLSAEPHPEERRQMGLYSDYIHRQGTGSPDEYVAGLQLLARSLSRR